MTNPETAVSRANAIASPLTEPDNTSRGQAGEEIEARAKSISPLREPSTGPLAPNSPIRIFIGWDSKEALAATVLARSIQHRSSAPVAISEIRLDQLKAVLHRERHPLQSTEFSFSRFLVPYLCDYEGFAVFMDCDMLCQGDIAELWAKRDPAYAIQVVKHDYQPTHATKFLNQPQTPYAKKNWSSVILFNNSRCRSLTPEYVNTATGLELHQFKWLEEQDIGELPERWNHLVRTDLKHSQR